AVGILYGSSINALLYGYFFQAEDGIRDRNVTGVQTCALPSSLLLGTLFGTFISFTYITWNQHVITLLFWGGIHGIFNGMLAAARSEEHTSELQSRFDLVCRLLLEKKKQKIKQYSYTQSEIAVV